MMGNRLSGLWDGSVRVMLLKMEVSADPIFVSVQPSAISWHCANPESGEYLGIWADQNEIQDSNHVVTLQHPAYCTM
jgi:hypothetical protein